MTSQAQNENVYHLPEPGQLAEVRRRQWVVKAVDAGSVDNGATTQHMVTLSSLDEDALGQELKIVWEVEPGASIIEKAGLPEILPWQEGLPTPYDTPEQFKAFLDAVRWGAVTSADKKQLQSPFRSGITIEDYQLDPVVRALDMAHVNLLIADDVGLGKTIEAGLVIQEMLVRHRARTIMIVCPSSLQIKWQTEMREKFGLEFEIVDTAYLKALRRSRGIHMNPWKSSPRLITSMDWVKNGEGLRLLKEILPANETYPRPFDILVVDEAHNVAPTRLANYSTESQRTRFIRLIAPHFAHHLFLSATPHNGFSESFTALLEMLDPQRFARNVMPDQKQLFSVMVRRLKDALPAADGTQRFARRELHALEINYTKAEKTIHAMLTQYTQLRQKKAQACDKTTEFGTMFVNLLLKKRLFSSPTAFYNTLCKHADSVRAAERGQYDASRLKAMIDRTLEDYADDDQRMIDQDEATEAASACAPELEEDESKLLDKLLAAAKKAADKPDSKAEALIAWLNEKLRPNGTWNDERVILFTEYRDTQSWLWNLLQNPSLGFGGKNDAGQPYIMMLNGSMLSEEREAVKAAFQASPAISGVRILIATDAAAEGIDLQNHCHYLIHLEIPWNPNVMEQRNGRIDRHGQTHDTVDIWHPVGAGFDPNKPELSYIKKASDLEGDSEYLMRAVQKVEAIRHDLGSMGDVIAHQIEEGMLDLRSHFDFTSRQTNRNQAAALLREERNLRERIQELHTTLLNTREACHLTPDRIERAVNVALQLAEKPALMPTDDPKIFRMPLLEGSWARAREGLEHPFTHQERAVTFDHDTAKGRDDLVLIHLNHPLVQMSLRLLREELWSQSDIRHLNRVSVRQVPRQYLSGNAVVVYSRLVITGDDQRRLHEELTTAGGYLKTDTFKRFETRTKLDEALSHSEPCDVDPRRFELFAKSYQNSRDAIFSACQARSRDLLKSLENKLQEAEKNEIANMKQVLGDLEANLKKELGQTEHEQRFLPGMSPEETAQMRRDYDSLRARLARIPQELADEIAHIQTHYANPIDRTFPAGVVFLMPV